MTQAKWIKGKFTPTSRSDEPLPEVSAYIRGPFALCKTGKRADSWKLSHIKSGLSIMGHARNARRKNLEIYADRLLQVWSEWDFKYASEAGPAWRDAVAPVVREFAMRMNARRT